MFVYMCVLSVSSFFLSLSTINIRTGEGGRERERERDGGKERESYVSVYKHVTA